MKQSARTSLLSAAALLMLFDAAANALVLVPDLHGDLVEIGVRPSVLGGTVRSLYFAALAMFAFAAIVANAAIQTLRGMAPARVPLAMIASVYAIFGVTAFSGSHNLHHLAPALMGVLVGSAIAIPQRR